MGEVIRQQYHLEPDRGLLNDPNGLTWFQGKYYVFFQWNRFKKDHSYKEWGLFTSVDLVNWEFEGSAILPEQDYEKNGVYSGSGYVIGDSLYLFYTGNRKTDGQRKSSQCLAVTKDGKSYRKAGIVVETPEEYSEHFRDPKVFQGKDKSYYMIIGGQQKSGKGALALCRSEDGSHWEYQHMLAVSKQYEMIECPDLFELDGRNVLLYNLQKRNNETDEDICSFSAYKLEVFDEAAGTFRDTGLDNGYRNVDAGFDFYAPQTFLSPDGRRLLFGWMSRMNGEQEKIFSKTEPNIHCLTMPRELFLEGEILCQKPAREMYGLLGEEFDVMYENGAWRAGPKERIFFMRLQMTGKDKNLQIEFHQGEAGLEYRQDEKEFIFFRRSWADQSMESRTESVDSLDEIEVWSDHSSMEIFVNGGKLVFSARIFPQCRQPEITIKGNLPKEKIQICNIMTPKRRNCDE